MSRTPLPRAARAPLAAVGGLLLAAAPALADRASLTLEQSVYGRSNLFRSADDEEADGSYQVRPRIRAERPGDGFRYVLEYAPTYDVFFQTDGIDGFDHFGRVELAYAPSPVGTARARADLAYYRSIRSDTVEGPAGIPEVVPDVTGRVFRAIADAGYEHAFSPTTRGELTLGLQSYDYSTPNNADSLGFGGELGLEHELRPELALGGLLFASHRRFDDLGTQADSTNTVVHLAPTLRALPTPTLSLEVEVGPALVLTDRDAARPASVSRFRTVGDEAAIFSGCGVVAGQPLLSECPLASDFLLPGVVQGQEVTVDYVAGGRPGSRDDETVTVFGRAALRKEESWGYAGLEYFRLENASSGSGATSIRDSVTATVSIGGEGLLRRGHRWGLRLRGNWNQRETVERIPQSAVVAGSSPFFAGGGQFYAEAEELVVVDRERRVVTQYWGEATLRRRFTDAVSAEVEVRYLRQERSGGAGPDEDFDDWRGSLMLRVELPEIEYGW